MAEPTFLGVVYVWGLDGTLLYSGMAITENEPQSLNFSDDISRHDSKDKKGATQGVQLYNPNPKLSITFMPRATNTGAGAIAAAKANVILPPKGANVALADFPPDAGTAEGVAINSAKWKYLGGGTIGFTNEGEVTMTLPLERFATDLAVDNA